MARTDFLSPRLCVDAALEESAAILLDPYQRNYLVNVLRLKDGARVLAFNGRDGEFAATLALNGRRDAALKVGERLREQEAPADVDYLFAPLKHARLDYMAQKAVELGVKRLQPVITRRTQVARVNLERLRANVREAAEQCGVLWLAEVSPERPLGAILVGWPAGRLLIFCDEDAPARNPIEALTKLSAPFGLSVLIGPEGGFDEAERAEIGRLKDAVSINLGPRVMRADTAAVAALTLAQACLGDWR